MLTSFHESEDTVKFREGEFEERESEQKSFKKSKSNANYLGPQSMCENGREDVYLLRKDLVAGWLRCLYY